LATATVAEWLERFHCADVPASAVLDVAGHLTDPHVVNNRVYQVYPHPERGRVRAARYPLGFADYPPVLPVAYPEPGQHNTELFARVVPESVAE
jgi:crotonobetainyl-CoA:carnitine CoA-transferase CaiB-like acyl-CoA transferase